LIEKVKSLLGDAWDDGMAEELSQLGSSAISSAVKSAVDAEKAKRLKASKSADERKAKIEELTAQLEAAGQADEALAAALKKAGESQAEAEKLRSTLRARDIADAATKALMGAELDGGRKIPADRLPSALKLLDLEGVDLDESGSVVGLEAKVEALKADNAFLWEAGEAGKGSGNGGKRTGAEPPPKGSKPNQDADSPAAIGAMLATQAYQRRGGRRPEVKSHGS
jgi:hypothetical protein